MNANKNVSFPNEMLEKLKIERTIFTPTNDEIGVAALSEVDGSLHILRLYQLILLEEDGEYHPIQELVAFSFDFRQELIDFLERLPTITGLEMLMILNPLTPETNFN